MKTSRTTLTALAITTLAGPLLAATAPAYAHGGGGAVTTRGGCGAHTVWKLKVKPDDGRIELEAELDSDRAGQVWHWRLSHNDSVSARGTGTTSGASGSFDVHRRMSDLAGTANAGNPRSASTNPAAPRIVRRSASRRVMSSSRR